MYKIKNFAHQEPRNNKFHYRENIVACIEGGLDFKHTVESEHDLMFVDIDESYPQYIWDFVSKYPHFIKEEH